MPPHVLSSSWVWVTFGILTLFGVVGLALIALCGYCISTTIQVRRLQDRVVGLERLERGRPSPSWLASEVEAQVGLRQLQGDVARLRRMVLAIGLEHEHPRARLLSQGEDR